MSKRDSFSLRNPFNFVIQGALGLFDTLKAGFASLNIFNHLGSLTLLFLLIQIVEDRRQVLANREHKLQRVNVQFAT